jgi:hypothetical protein
VELTRRAGDATHLTREVGGGIGSRFLFYQQLAAISALYISGSGTHPRTQALARGTTTVVVAGGDGLINEVRFGWGV